MKSKFVNPALFKLERRKGLSALIWFSVITGVLVFVTCALFSTVQQILSDNEMLSKLGISLTSMAEYFDAEAVQMWMLPVLLFVACSVVSTTTSEFRNGSFELIYSLNVSRTEVVRTKFIKVVLDIVIINVVAFLMALTGMAIFAKGDFNFVNLLVYLLLAICVSIQVAMFIFAIALLGKKRMNMFGSVILVLVSYLLCTLMNVGADKSTQWLGFFTPLSTLNGSIMQNGFAGLFKNGIVLLVWTAVSVVLFVCGILKFKKEDLV